MEAFVDAQARRIGMHIGQKRPRPTTEEREPPPQQTLPAAGSYLCTDAWWIVFSFLLLPERCLMRAANRRFYELFSRTRHIDFTVVGPVVKQNRALLLSLTGAGKWCVADVHLVAVAARQQFWQKVASLIQRGGLRSLVLHGVCCVLLSL